MQLNFEVDDLYWAMAYAGVVRNAKKGFRRECNPKFRVHFKSEDPLVQYLGKSFDSWEASEKVIRVPDEKELILCDRYMGLKSKVEVEQIQGVLSGASFEVRLGISSAAAAWVMYRYEIVSEGEYWFPKPKNSELEDYRGYDAIVSEGRFEELALSFLKVNGKDGAKIWNIEQQGMFGAFFCAHTPECRLAVTCPIHPLQPLFRTFYKGFDQMEGAKPLITIIPSDFAHNDRHAVSWACQIAIPEEGAAGWVEAKANAWREREAVGHDFHRYVRKRAGVA